MLAGLPAPAPGPQPYLGKIFSCRRRGQEGLSVALSINSCLLGLPSGLGSPGVGVRRPALRSPALHSPPPGAHGPGQGARPLSRVCKRQKEQRRGPGSWWNGLPAAAGLLCCRPERPRGALLGAGARRAGPRGAASSTRGESGGGSGSTSLRGRGSRVRAEPACGRKSFPNCGRWQGLKHHHTRFMQPGGAGISLEAGAPSLRSAHGVAWVGSYPSLDLAFRVCRERLGPRNGARSAAGESGGAGS